MSALLKLLWFYNCFQIILLHFSNAAVLPTTLVDVNHTSDSNYTYLAYISSSSSTSSNDDLLLQSLTSNGSLPNAETVNTTATTKPTMTICVGPVTFQQQQNGIECISANNNNNNNTNENNNNINVTSPISSATVTAAVQAIENAIDDVSAVISNEPFSIVNDAQVSMSGVADVIQTPTGAFKFDTQLNVSKTTENICPSLTTSDATSLSQTQLVERLTAPCHYDRLELPRPLTPNGTPSDDPVVVHVRTYIYVMQNVNSNTLQFQMHGLLQLRFNDPRLAFGKLLPQRRQPLMGEAQLRNLIWVPHIFLANEHSSSVLGTNEKDILTSISPDGTVIISARIQATLYCWMELMKFPFDEQNCKTILESWMYTTSDLVLHWESHSPLTFDPKTHLTEYALQSAWTNESIVNADMNDLRHGALTGNYSTLSFTVHLTREVGYYMMDYFVPSMMLVCISWVSFWLQPDQTPARTTLGTSTMLAFITLAASQDKQLPKVNYIKISEIWFLGCTVFIFGSLVEFTFVNTIWRRRRDLELKKINSKYIFKSTLTPRPKRRELPNTLAKSETSMTLVLDNFNKGSNNNFLTVDTPPALITNGLDKYVNTHPRELSKCDSVASTISIDENSPNDVRLTITKDTDKEKKKKGKKEKKDKKDNKETWTTMSPHEVSSWIDRKARFIFPLAFIIFNAAFWLFVYCL